MKLISYILFSLLFFSGTHLKAGEFSDKISKLVDKGYTFYAFKKDTIYYLNGKRRYQKISFPELYQLKNFSTDPDPHHSPGIARDMVYYHKQGFKIILRKNKNFYSFKNGKISKYDPIKNRENFNVKKIKSRVVEKTHCKYCTFKLSGNLITIDDVVQYNGEFAWLPYLRLTDTTGFRLSLGASPYTIENDDLDEVISIGLKAQVLLRQYFWHLFFEIGGGTHYFVEYGDFSSTATTGVGYTFANRMWFLDDNISLNSIFFHASTVNWDQRINEAKVGIGFSF